MKWVPAPAQLSVELLVGASPALYIARPVMTPAQLSPEQVQDLLERAQATYLDVRSEVEFDQGHPPTAVNIPLQHVEGDRLVENVDFLRVVTQVFSKEHALVVGCHSGSRSHRAAQLLANAGFVQLAELAVGFDGKRDAFGRLSAGWRRKGLPVETDAQPHQRYAMLHQSALARALEVVPPHGAAAPRVRR